MFRVFATATFLALAMTAAAQAETASVQVPYGDLNLSNPSNAAVLADRLRGAAVNVCRAIATDQHLNDAQMQACVATAIDTAMARLEVSLNRKVSASVTSVRDRIVAINN